MPNKSAKFAIGLGVFGPPVFILAWDFHAGTWNESPLHLFLVAATVLLWLCGVTYCIVYNLRKDRKGEE